MGILLWKIFPRRNFSRGSKNFPWREAGFPRAIKKTIEIFQKLKKAVWFLLYLGRRQQNKLPGPNIILVYFFSLA